MIKTTMMDDFFRAWDIKYQRFVTKFESTMVGNPDYVVWVLTRGKWELLK